MADPRFELFFMGDDTGVYALARAFHARYGVRSVAVSRQGFGPVQRSNIITSHTVGAGAPLDSLVDWLIEYAVTHPTDLPRLLMTNGDIYVKAINERRADLAEHYVLTIAASDALRVVNDKGTFAELAAKLDIPTPASVLVDFSGADADDWAAPATPFTFPVVGKAAWTPAYAGVDFPGKRKVFLFESQEQLDEVLQALRSSGFRDRFVVQELIPGDDTWLRSVTAYRDSGGRVTLLCSAHILLQEHTPLTLGNPAAIITTPFPEQWAQAERFLHEVNWHGFAQFDIKVDPRDGVAKFLEMNPRSGRNNYHVTATGANLSEFVVADVIEHREMPRTEVTREILYCIVPLPLLLRYVNSEQRAKILKLARRGIFSPLWNPRHETLWRDAYAMAVRFNHVRKFMTHYPRPSRHGF